MTNHNNSTHHVLMGRAFAIVADFEHSEEGTRAANAFMEEHPGTGVLAVAEGRVIVASNSDSGVAIGPRKNLLCACCGGRTEGRQWHNQDTGFGLCESCEDFVASRKTPEELYRCHGIKGVHFNIGRTD